MENANELANTFAGPRKKMTYDIHAEKRVPLWGVSMNWTVSKEFRFEAAHMLPFHDGPCRRLHGHSYRFSLFVRGESLHQKGPKTGMVLDFKDIGEVGKEITQKLDHQYLNEVLNSDVTTAEWMSKWIFEFASERLENMWAVEMKETESSLARYCPGEGRILKIGNLHLQQIKERLYKNILTGGTDECWPFIGIKDHLGYGYCACELAETNKAHRLCAWLEGWDIAGKVVMHTCDNPSCCNPRHLRVGTHQENEQDKDRKGRRPRGEKQGSALLTDSAALAIWTQYQRGGKKDRSFCSKWAKKMGLSNPQVIGNLVHGWGWNHITGLPIRNRKTK